MSIDPEDYVEEAPTQLSTAPQRKRRPRKRDGRAPGKVEKQSPTPRNTVPLKERVLFKTVHLLGQLQSQLMRLTGETLYVSADGHTTLVSKMRGPHLINAINKMGRENNRNDLYDVLVLEAKRRGLLPGKFGNPTNPLEDAYDAVKALRNKWYRRLGRTLTLRKT